MAASPAEPCDCVEALPDWHVRVYEHFMLRLVHMHVARVTFYTCMTGRDYMVLQSSLAVYCNLVITFKCAHLNDLLRASFVSFWAVLFACSNTLAASLSGYCAE